MGFSPARGAELDARQSDGKKIYTTGIGTTEDGIQADIAGGISLPATDHPCVQCHGVQGKGGQEGGVLISDITWERLSAPYGIPTMLGGTRPPYTKKTFFRAIREGIASSGEDLDIMMPHYRINNADLESLYAYIQAIGKEDAPGTDAATIRIGTLLPMDSPGGQGRAIALLLQRYFDKINRGGGIHGRNIKLVVTNAGNSEDNALNAARRLINKNGIFAFIANAGMGAHPRVLGLLEGFNIPVFGPLTFAHGVPQRGSVFYLLASLEDEGRAAARYLKSDNTKTEKNIGLLYGTDGGSAEMVEGFTDEAKKIGLALQFKSPWDGNSATRLVESLYESGIDTVVFFGNAGQVQNLLSQAKIMNWSPSLMTSTVLLGGRLRSYKQAAFISPPLAPGAVGVNDNAFLNILNGGASNKNAATDRKILLNPANRSMLMAAYASARLLTDGLTCPHYLPACLRD